MWSAEINNMAHLCRPDIEGSIGGMEWHRRIRDIIFCKQYWEIVPIQVTSNTMTTSAHRLILIAPYKSRRVKEMKKWIYYF